MDAYSEENIRHFDEAIVRQVLVAEPEHRDVIGAAADSSSTRWKATIVPDGSPSAPTNRWNSPGPGGGRLYGRLLGPDRHVGLRRQRPHAFEELRPTDWCANRIRAPATVFRSACLADMSTVGSGEQTDEVRSGDQRCQTHRSQAFTRVS